MNFIRFWCATWKSAWCPNLFQRLLHHTGIQWACCIALRLHIRFVNEFTVDIELGRYCRVETLAPTVLNMFLLVAVNKTNGFRFLLFRTYWLTCFVHWMGYNCFRVAPLTRSGLLLTSIFWFISLYEISCWKWFTSLSGTYVFKKYFCLIHSCCTDEYSFFCC